MDAVGSAEDASSAREKGIPFSAPEDELLIAEACVYENDYKHGDRALQLRFWENVRRVFAEREFEPRGPVQLKSLQQSPYQKRWAHIRTSFEKVFKLVTRNGAKVPTSQQELNRLVETAKQVQSQKGQMKKLGLGFRHFSTIFWRTGGWASASGSGGRVSNGAQYEYDATSAAGLDDDEHSEVEQDSTADIDSGNEQVDQEPVTMVRSPTTPPPPAAAPSRKRPAAASSLADLADQTARRARQTYGTVSRLEQSMGAMCARMDGLISTIASLANSTAYKAQVLAQLSNSIATTPDQTTKDQLQTVFDMIFAELQVVRQV